MKGLLGILGISILIIIVINPVYAIEVMGSASEVKTMDTPKGTLEYRALYVDADNAAGIIEPPGGDNDGVGDFLFNQGFRCTASLLAESNMVPVALTAAHCVSDGQGNFNLQNGATVTFETSCGDEEIGVQEAWTQIHPNWQGDDTGLFFGNDIALLELDKFPEPCTGDNVDRYFIDRNAADDIGLMSEDVGFGRSGTGLTGDILGAGTKRASTNTLDLGDNFFAFFPIVTTPGSQLVDDFDNGLVAQDANGNGFLGLVNDPVGKGLDEGTSAGGDSGGPHFNGAKEISAVTSWGARLMGPGGNGNPDINDELDSSFGEWSGDTRVATYAGWIDERIRVLEDNKMEKTAVGGEFIGIDTTAVLLAGAQMNAAWLIPLIVAAAVIGIVISRKF